MLEDCNNNRSTRLESTRSSEFGLSPGAEKKWYVVYSKPRLEAVAQENLQRQSFETYLPLIALHKRRKGTVKQFVEPFFPRYLFLHLDSYSDDWSPIRSTRGVGGIVRFEGIAKAVPDRLIESLKRNENNQGFQEIDRPIWKPGDHIAIEDGPFAGYRCIFQAMKGVDRVSVLLNIIGKQTRTTLLKRDLQIPQFA